ncbi:MAG: DUF1552 domain-containing protein [Planctomycetota bacterium]
MRNIIDRRTVLQGLGASLALPFLEIMQPARALGVVQRPRRLVCLFMPNGVNPHRWTPKGEGDGYELSEALQPLAGARSKVLVLTNLWNAQTRRGDGHYVKTAAWLTGTSIHKTTGGDLDCRGVSMDQIAARRIGHLTKLPSLELSMEPVTSGVDANVGYTRLYGSHISWSTPTTPLTREINPRRAFDRLFRTTRDRRSTAEDKSILDLVLDDAKALQKQLGRADTGKLTEYLDSVRAVEKRLEAAEAAEEIDADVPDWRARREVLAGRFDRLPKDTRLGVPEYCDLMLDVIALALWSDTTRIASLMFGNSVSNKSFSFLHGVTAGHHHNSHHQDDPQKLAEYTRITQWHVAQFVGLLRRLESMQEVDGSSVLDHAMVLFGSGLRDGNSHNPRNLPILLGGGGGGTLRPGRHVVYPKDTPFCNLHRALLSRMGTPIERIGDSTAELDGLT